MQRYFVATVEQKITSVVHVHVQTETALDAGSLAIDKVKKDYEYKHPYGGSIECTVLEVKEEE